MEGIIQLALLVLIVASVIFLFACPSAISEIANSLSKINFSDIKSNVKLDVTRDHAGDSDLVTTGKEIGDGLKSISETLLDSTYKSVMFKCDDETIFSLSSVVCTCKDGKGFRVEIATHGNVITSKLISNDDHERMLDRMNDLGYFQGSRMSKSIIPVRRLGRPNEV